MKFYPQNLKYLNSCTLIFIICLFSNAATAENNIIRCKTIDEEEYRIWKFKYKNELVKLWTLNANIFYPFCSAGFSVEFPNGQLCAYKKDKKVGTVATFIDLKEIEITDILITEDTVLSDPSTWLQKIKTSCELIRG